MTKRYTNAAFGGVRISAGATWQEAMPAVSLSLFFVGLFFTRLSPREGVLRACANSDEEGQEASRAGGALRRANCGGGPDAEDGENEDM